MDDLLLRAHGLSDRIPDFLANARTQEPPALLGPALVLDQLSRAHVCMGRTARAQRRDQSGAAWAWHYRSAVESALQLFRRDRGHGPCADAARGADHAFGDGEH